MMTMACQHRLILVSLGVLLTAAASASAQTVSLKAVRLNPECVGGADEGAFCARDVDCDSGVCSGAITPTNEVQAGPGDVIVCEIYASDWSPDNLLCQQLKFYQVQIDGSQFGTDLPVMPLFWDYPDTSIICEGPEDCTPGDICWIHEGIQGLCAGPNHHPEDGAFIDSMRSDYVFAPAGSPPPEFKATDLSTPSFRYASSALLLPLEFYYIPPSDYVATLTLEVLPDACSTFTVDFLGEPYTFLMSVCYVVTTPNMVGLEIDTGLMCPHGLISVYPSNGAIDARQPTEPDGQSATGWDSMKLIFDPGFDPCTLGIGDFSIREVPLGLTTLEIADVSCSYDPPGLTLHLNRPILPQTWTCIMHMATLEEFCIALLPGDVNGDGVASPADILYLVDSLNGIVSPPFEIWQTDIDRSGATGAPDIVRLIDLLNGAGAYEPWLNRKLPMACPSAP